MYFIQWLKFQMKGVREFLIVKRSDGKRKDLLFVLCLRSLGRLKLVESKGASPLPLSTSLLLSSPSSPSPKGFSCSGSWIWTIFSPVQLLFQPSERGVSQNWQVVAAELIPGALCACAAATIFASCATGTLDSVAVMRENRLGWISKPKKTLNVKKLYFELN